MAGLDPAIHVLILRQIEDEDPFFRFAKWEGVSVK
jgi:hypothetical protein